jgi:hypothetical protein
VLQIVANTNEIADSTLAGLHDQRRQMEAIDDDVNRVCSSSLPQQQQQQQRQPQHNE